VTVAWYSQHTLERLPYHVDWSAFLTSLGDTIASCTWTGDDQATTDELELDDQGHESGVHTVVISGGVAYTTYELTSSITTVGGLAARQSIRLRVTGTPVAVEE
jgi:hypothetical protein